MLLPYIVDQLDAELDRLQRLRAIVATLQMPLTFHLSPELDADAGRLVEEVEKGSILPSALPSLVMQRQPGTEGTNGSEIRRARKRRSDAGQPRAKRGRTATPEMPAAIRLSERPSPGVVVMSPQQLEQERARREVRRGQAGAGDSPETGIPPMIEPVVEPESLARTLAARWLTGGKTEGEASSL